MRIAGNQQQRLPASPIRFAVSTPLRVPGNLLGRRFFAVLALIAAGITATLCSGQESEPQPEATESVATEEPMRIDEPAHLFVTKCAGCHTVGAGALSGPDLVPVINWPPEDLRKSIVLMEREVGPLQSDEIDSLLAFLQHDDRIDRLRVEQDRAALEQAASYEPGSVRTGAALFSGRRAFANRGVSCAACHNAGSNGGGNFAPDLTDAFARMGEMPLLSACEGGNYPIMRTCYEDRPIQKQEAIHLVAYLGSVSELGESPSLASQVIIRSGALVLAALCIAIVLVVSLRRNQSVRAEMVRGAMKRNSP